MTGSSLLSQIANSADTVNLTLQRCDVGIEISHSGRTEEPSPASRDELLNRKSFSKRGH